MKSKTQKFFQMVLLCNMQHSVIYNYMFRPCKWAIIRLTACIRKYIHSVLYYWPNTTGMTHLKNVGTLFWDTLSFFLQSNDRIRCILEAFHKLSSYITLTLQNLSVNNESSNSDQTTGVGNTTNPIKRDSSPYERTRFCVDYIKTTHASHNLGQGKKMTRLRTSWYSQKGFFCYPREF